VVYTHVTKFLSAEEITKRPEFGCFSTGFYLEGARWDVEKGCLEK